MDARRRNRISNPGVGLWIQRRWKIVELRLCRCEYVNLVLSDIIQNEKL